MTAFATVVAGGGFSTFDTNFGGGEGFGIVGPDRPQYNGKEAGEPANYCTAPGVPGPSTISSWHRVSFNLTNTEGYLNWPTGLSHAVVNATIADNRGPFHPETDLDIGIGIAVYEAGSSGTALGAKIAQAYRVATKRGVWATFFNTGPQLTFPVVGGMYYAIVYEAYADWPFTTAAPEENVFIDAGFGWPQFPEVYGNHGPLTGSPGYVQYLNLIMRGNNAPVAMTVHWGDGTTSTVTVPVPTIITSGKWEYPTATGTTTVNVPILTHQYDEPGSYVTTITGLSTNGETMGDLVGPFTTEISGSSAGNLVTWVEPSLVHYQ